MSSIWESLYGPNGKFSGSNSNGLLGASQPASVVVTKSKTGRFALWAILAVVIVTAIVLGFALFEYRRKKDEEKQAAAIASGTAPLPPSSGFSLSTTPVYEGAIQPKLSTTEASPFYPPLAPSSSQPKPIPQSDPGRPGTEAAWWHNVERYDLVSQSAVDQFGGWWPAAPEIQGRSRGQFYKGYGDGVWQSGPYLGGYLTFPSNFIPLSTTQISVTDLHPFCSKQR